MLACTCTPLRRISGIEGTDLGSVRPQRLRPRTPPARSPSSRPPVKGYKIGRCCVDQTFGFVLYNGVAYFGAWMISRICLFHWRLKQDPNFFAKKTNFAQFWKLLLKQEVLLLFMVQRFLNWATFNFTIWSRWRDHSFGIFKLTTKYFSTERSSLPDHGTFPRWISKPQGNCIERVQIRRRPTDIHWSVDKPGMPESEIQTLGKKLLHYLSHWHWQLVVSIPRLSPPYSHLLGKINTMGTLFSTRHLWIPTWSAILTINTDAS